MLNMNSVILEAIAQELKEKEMVVVVGLNNIRHIYDNNKIKCGYLNLNNQYLNIVNVRSLEAVKLDLNDPDIDMIEKIIEILSNTKPKKT